jgi:hypothetical protein
MGLGLARFMLQPTNLVCIFLTRANIWKDPPSLVCDPGHSRRIVDYIYLVEFSSWLHIFSSQPQTSIAQKSHKTICIRTSSCLTILDQEPTRSFLWMRRTRVWIFGEVGTARPEPKLGFSKSPSTRATWYTPVRGKSELNAVCFSSVQKFLSRIIQCGK